MTPVNNKEQKNEYPINVLRFLLKQLREKESKNTSQNIQRITGSLYVSKKINFS